MIGCYPAVSEQSTTGSSSFDSINRVASVAGQQYTTARRSSRRRRRDAAEQQQQTAYGGPSRFSLDSQLPMAEPQRPLLERPVRWSAETASTLSRTAPSFAAWRGASDDVSAWLEASASAATVAATGPMVSASILLPRLACPCRLFQTVLLCSPPPPPPRIRCLLRPLQPPPAAPPASAPAAPQRAAGSIFPMNRQ